MDVGMMVEGLAPGMQDPEKANLGASMLGITGNGLEGLGDGLKQQGAQLVVLPDFSCYRRQALLRQATVDLQTPSRGDRRSRAACRML